EMEELSNTTIDSTGPNSNPVTTNGDRVTHDLVVKALPVTVPWPVNRATVGTTPVPTRAPAATTRVAVRTQPPERRRLRREPHTGVSVRRLRGLRSPDLHQGTDEETAGEQDDDEGQDHPPAPGRGGGEDIPEPGDHDHGRHRVALDHVGVEVRRGVGVALGLGHDPPRIPADGHHP